MAGIGDMAKAQPMGVPMEGRAPQAEGDEGENAPNVTPEEQAVYDRVMLNALKIVYPEGEAEATVSPKILAALKGSDNPMLNLSTATVSLVIGLRDSAKQAGNPVPDDVLYHAAIAIVEELAEVAEAANIHDYSEKDIENAFYGALDMYRSAATQSGDIDTDGLKQGWDELVTADREGRVGEIMPGIEGRMKDAEGSAEAPA